MQQYITRYVLSVILVLGTLGNLTAIRIFLQKKYRTNSCSIYLVAMSVFGLIAANWGIAPLVYALDHFDVVNSSVVLCRIRGYIIHVNGMCFRYTLILMCADRYALCSPRASVRALCRPKIAYRLIGIVIIFWIVISSHLLILESIQNNRCGVNGLYGQIFSFYTLIFTGIIPISTMTVLSILLLKSFRQLRTRVQPFDNTTQMRPRDIKLMKLVLVEMIVYILCTFSNPVVTIYTQITNSIVPNKSAEQKQIEAFVNFITLSVFIYLNYNTTFYVHILTSKTYRKEVKQLVLKLIGRPRVIQQTQESTLQSTIQIPRRQQAQGTSAV